MTFGPVLQIDLNFKGDFNQYYFDTLLILHPAQLLKIYCFLQSPPSPTFPWGWVPPPLEAPVALRRLSQPPLPFAHLTHLTSPYHPPHPSLTLFLSPPPSLQASKRRTVFVWTLSHSFEHPLFRWENPESNVQRTMLDVNFKMGLVDILS